MNAIILDFETRRQEYRQKILAQKEQLIFECRQDILNTEEQIRYLAQQINELQANIELNYRLIAKISRRENNHNR